MRESYTAPIFLELQEGYYVTSPPDGSSVIVLARFWRNAPLGARQTRCEGCDALLGISPENWQYHQQHPLTSAVLCLLCACEFRRVYRERWKQQAARIREHLPKRKGKVRRVQ